MSTSRGQDSDAVSLAPVALDEPSRRDLVPIGSYDLQPSDGPAWQATSRPRPEMLSAAPDPLSLLRAFKRRWLLATGLGVLVAIGVVALAWFLIPQTGDVVAYMRVARNPELVLAGNVGASRDDFEVFKATTMQMMRSRMSLTRALREPKVSQLAIVQEQNDPVDWLERKLSLEYPGNAEILQVRMRGSDEDVDDLVIIVNAVVDAYFKEVVDVELKERDAKLVRLEKEFGGYNEQLVQESKEIERLARQLGTHDPQLAQVHTTMLQTQLSTANSNLMHAYQEVDTWSTELEKFTLEKTMAEDRASILIFIQDKLHNDHKVKKLEEDIAEYDSALARYKQSVVPGKVNHTAMHLQKERAGLQEKLEERIKELEEKFVEPERVQRLQLAENRISVARNQLERLTAKIESSKKAIELTTKELHEVGGNTAEMINKRNIAANLQKLVERVHMQVQEARIEKGSPPRVSRLGDAMRPERIAVTRKLALVGFSGLATFCLVGLGVAFMEFQSRRITCSSDLQTGLGIRVVGTLPSMARPGRKALAAVNGDLSSLLVESIDTVRTNLLHCAASEPMRVVMITSALDREGKTTVASQLAASLARCGRRTLLIDGDLRRPSVHRLFELPLEPGLCEVLRTEAELDDVIRPTRIAGLWMIAAGQYDLESIQALSREGARDFFEMLQSRFDFIIVDAAPVLSIADSSMLGQLVDAAILCVMRDVSQAANVYEASEQLHSVGVEVLGAVINGEKSAATYRAYSARK